MYDPDELPLRGEPKETKPTEVKKSEEKPSVTKGADVKVEKKENFIPMDDLPSLYRFYPPGTSIEARPLTVSEVKQLASINEENAEFVINDIISRSTRGIDFNSILSVDKFYILFWLRANTYKSAGYETEYQCSHCGKDTNYHFNVSVFDVVYVREDHKDYNTINLPSGGDTLVMKFLRLEDEKRIRDFLSMAQRNNRKYDPDLLELAASIDSINGNKKSLRENYEFVDSMDPENFAYLMSYVDDTIFGVSSTIKASCAFCGEVSPVAIRFQKEFFIPKYKLR